MTLHKQHKKSTGAGFQDKKVSAGVGITSSEASSEKKTTRDELASTKSKSGLPNSSTRKKSEMNVNDRHEPKFQGRAPLFDETRLGEVTSQETTDIFEDRKLREYKKPSQLEGNKLQKWQTKCFERRQQRKSLGVKNEKQNASHQPWERVERNKIKTNSMFRFATWNVRTLRTLTSLTLVADDLKKHKILVAGLQECRWLDETNGRKEGEYKFWGGGAWKNDAHATQEGVAIAFHKSLWKSDERFILESG